ncbi:MAG: GNAT family N-acetyltransferase, partial [Candidatus Marinimicrobia bacterium]|nr:GNAT family N-acetyltransferase [Candidatus Neomarinimicrobiota bacterium]
MSDAPSIAKYANNRKIWRNLSSTFPHPYTEDDAVGWLGEVASGAFSEDVYAIEIEGEAVGIVGFKPMELVYEKSLG